MHKTLRTLSLISAAVLVFTLTVATETLCQTPSAKSDNQNSSTTADTTSSIQPSNQPSADLVRALGNYSIIRPSKLNNNSTGNRSDGNNNDGDAVTPPATNPPAPSPAGGAPTQVSGFSDRAIARDRNAPRRDNLAAIKIIDHVNGLLGGFEQGAGFGFGLEFTTNKEKELKGYEIYARLLGSTRLYRRGEAGVKVGTDRTRGEVWFGYVRRTEDNFFNIGPLTPEINETNYDTEQRSYNGLFAHKFSDRIEAGLYGRFTNTSSYRGENDRDPAIDLLFSGNPLIMPVTQFLPGLQTNVKLTSYGVFTEIDLRNNERGLVKGGYFYGRFGSVDGIDNDNAFADFGWIEAEFDGRVYIPIFSDKTSLALRAYADLKDPKGGSQIPFYELGWLGGRSYIRGFDTYRFRAENAVVFSGEIRQTVYSQNDENTRGLDLFVFAETGQVWGDNRSRVDPTIVANENFDDRNFRTGFGGGIQYRLNKSIAFRIEVGASNETTKVYFSQRPGF